MGKREDIKKILIIGPGPIIIGQACEFDYSGTQACKALKEEGYEVVLVNSNPATIMTDPETADKVYIEPITVNMVEQIIAFERPDALLPTMGGQTALNTAIGLHEKGVLEKYNVELIGANIESIKKAEDRELFKEAMDRIGLEVPTSGFCKSLEDALKFTEKFPYPLIIRPSFTLGGMGGGIAYNREEFEDLVKFGIEQSPVGEVLVEESVIGWKEFELEVMRDRADNVVIICSIENIDPMGIHTGDSITVAPAQTLTDKEYQMMRDASLKIIREIGVDTGGSNIQFSQNPENGKIYVIEMNPRVSRSSALASKATGFPIAKIAAKLSIGYTLDEIPNDITKKTPASFEPTIDYVVTKVPRFTFEKFPNADATLTTQMKSVGEAMSIGRTFKESLQKALSSMENGYCGFDRVVRTDRSLNENFFTPSEDETSLIKSKLTIPNESRPWYIGEAYRSGLSIDDVFKLTNIDKWFLATIKDIVDFEETIISEGKNITEITLRRAKEDGFSFAMLSKLTTLTSQELKSKAKEFNVLPVYKSVDTCGAEFESTTPYLYSTYEKPYFNIDSDEPIFDNEAPPTNNRKIIILGSGPNRIGQGIEFDYCCVHASFALREEGIESIMVNCNPETVSTDYDTSDRLYFEPLTFEHVMAIIDREKPDGVIVQLGGQTPLKLAVSLEEAGVKIIGTSPDSIDRAEDRERFDELLVKLNIKKPESGIARSVEEAVTVAEEIGYPVMIRPSYVLGGRAMETVYSKDELNDYMVRAVEASPEHPVLIDSFLQGAIEVDVDCISDGEVSVVAGIMEHIEEAGVHSGDSCCSLPPYSLSDEIILEIKNTTKALAKELNVIGLMNIQYAVKDGSVYIIEVNPRASRTVPFVSKSIGVPLAKLATKVMAGLKLKDLNFTEEVIPHYVSVKESVFPFIKFQGEDTLLGPEMKSTGEVMGIGKTFGEAVYKAQLAAGQKLPLKGKVFLSVKEGDKEGLIPVGKKLSELGFEIVATGGTAKVLESNGVDCSLINKVSEGRPHIVDAIKNEEINMVINTSFGAQAAKDSYSIRRSAIEHDLPYFTTIAGALASALAIENSIKEGQSIKALGEYHSELEETKHLKKTSE